MADEIQDVNGVDGARLLSYIERIEHIEEPEEHGGDGNGRLHDDDHEQELRQVEMQISPTRIDDIAQNRHGEHGDTQRGHRTPQHRADEIERLTDSQQHHQSRKRE